MKYCVLIIDGAAGLPLPERDNKTCLELARTPNLDALAAEGSMGLVRTVPEGMEPSSACACMSVMGYDPVIYYKGRAAIEARSMGIEIDEGEVVFRCNLVTVRNGRMLDYSAGHITSGEAKAIIDSLNEKLGSDSIRFYPGVGYRHILKIKGREDTASAVCTPPHDIPGEPVVAYLPKGLAGGYLTGLMKQSEDVLRGHQINEKRVAVGNLPVTTIWLFWGSGRVPEMPSFAEVYGLKAAMTSGVDLLRGLGLMAGMEILEIKGVTDGPDNDHVAQAEGALESLKRNDLVIIHIEAPDEAAHAGDIEAKVDAIEKIDKKVVGRLRKRRGDDLRVLLLPDHPTPIATRTHSADPVPFMLWGKGVRANGVRRFTETEVKRTGVFIEPGYKIMGRLVGGR